MTMKLTIDLADGSGATYARHGWQIDRTAIVEDVEGDGYKKVVNALACPGLPFIGWPHPYLPNTYLEEITVAAISGSTVHLRLHYSNPSKRANAESPTIEYNSGMSSEQTSKDKDAIEMTASYGGKSEKGVANVAASSKAITFTRVEAADPRAKWMEYDGAVNSIPFLGEAARTWFCVIRAASSNNGITWEVTYEFSYKFDTWDARVYWRDPATGCPPDDYEVELYRCIKEKDFNLLLLFL